MQSTFLTYAGTAVLAGAGAIAATPAVAQAADVDVVQPAASVDITLVENGDAADAASTAQSAMAKGKSDRAVKYAERAVASAPRSAAYRALLGQSYMKNGRFVAAKQAFGESIQLGSTDPSTVIGAILSRIAVGETADAVALADEYRNALPLSDYGLALALAGDADRGVYALTEAARAPDATARTRQNLALAMALSDRWAQAQIIAAQDVAPAKVRERMTEWAKLAKAEHPALRVAGLLNVEVQADKGMPVRLALDSSVQPVKLAALDPAPLAQYAPPAPVDAAPADVAPVDPAPAADYVPVASVPVALNETPVREVAPADVAVDPAPVAVAAVDAAADAPTIASEGDYRMPVADPAPVAVAVAAASAPEARRARTADVDALVEKSVAQLGDAKPARPGSASTSGWAVQVGAFTKFSSVEAGWSKISKRHGLTGYLATSHSASVRGKTYHRLTLNGIGSAREAQALCRTLQRAGQVCFARKMTGAEPIRWASREGVKLASR